jgi:putative transposase
VAARTVDGGALRILNVIDEHTRVALGSLVARSIGAREVTAHLGRLFAAHGKPAFIRADNGREVIADSVQEWLAGQQVRPVLSEKASPQQNCQIERFNGTMRRETLNGEVFHSVLEAKVVIEEFARLQHPTAHRRLAGQTPAAYAKMARSHDRDDRPGGGE